MLFDNKIALVTGGSSGIGLAIAKNLAKQGAKVIITGRNEASLLKAADEIGAGAEIRIADVTRVADIEELFAAVRRDHGRLDILVPSAGSTDPLTLGLITEEHFDQTIGGYLKGVVFTVQSALPLMQGGGSIIMIGSTASIDPPAGMSVYGAAKAGVRNLVRAWLKELKIRNLRINIVSPGPVRTPGLERFFPKEQAEAAFLAIAEASPIGRIGAPDDIAEAVSFLASDAARHIHGIELFVDGGTSQA